MCMSLIKCENLVKVFGGGKPVRALDGLTLEVNEGEVFGLLGPNGSGKTTFVRCCLNIIFPSSGSLSIFGMKPGSNAVTHQLGYLPENANFYDHLNAHQFLYYHAELSGIPLRDRKQRIGEVLETVKLHPDATRRRLRTYSKGMLQRIGLAQALINRPRLMFLDEPQTGLDPIGRKQVKDIMREAVSQGTTVLFSSHVLADVEDVADRIAIIHQGSLRRVAALKDITLDAGRAKVRLIPEGQSGIVPDSTLVEKVSNLTSDPAFTRVEFDEGVLSFAVDGENDVPAIVNHLVSQGFDIYGVTLGHQTLEQVFLKEFGEMDLTVRRPEDESKPLTWSS